MEMKDNQSKSEKQYFITQKKVHINTNTGQEIIEWEKVETTKEQFNDYYRPINAYRKRMQEHGRCICPANKRLTCNMDCWTCPYHTTGDEPYSLDESVTVDDGSEMNAYESIPSGEDIEGNYGFREEFIGQFPIAVQRQQIAQMKQKVSYYDQLLQNKNTVSITQIAKDYGMSGRKFNVLLHELGIQYKCRNTWILYQKYAEYGYTQSRTFVLDCKKNVMHTYWTQKGRIFLYECLKAEGILPKIENEEFCC